jgi:hypothetical protein
MKSGAFMKKMIETPLTEDSTDFSFIGLDPFPLPEINTFDDWLNFVYEPTLVRPNVPSLEEWAKMTAVQQKVSANERNTYIARFKPIMTPSRENVLNAVLRKCNANRLASRGARSSAVETGLPTIGKTTLALEIGKRYDLSTRKVMKRKYGVDDFIYGTQDRFLPVVYVSLSSDDVSNLKSLWSTLARFLGVVKYESKTQKKLEDAVVDHAKKSQTSLVIIDEIHYIDVRTKGVRRINNALKTMMNRIPATFLYAGINCDNTGIFEDHDDEMKKKENRASSQMNHRCARFELFPFQNTYGNYLEGFNLIKAMDQEIVLLNHQAGDLEALATYIMLRTNGFVGAIRDLIRQAGEEAIKSKTERFTRDLLEGIQLDNAAESYYAQHKDEDLAQKPTQPGKSTKASEPQRSKPKRSSRNTPASNTTAHP